VHTVIPLKQGGEQKQRIFEHLVHVKADASYPFAQTVVEEAVHLPPGTTLVLITPVLNHQLLKVMVDLAYRRIQVQLFLIKDKEPSKEEETLLASLPRKGIHYYTVTSDRFPARLVRRREANVYKPFTINN
jgi:hypothetical protein